MAKITVNKLAVATAVQKKIKTPEQILNLYSFEDAIFFQDESGQLIRENKELNKWMNTQIKTFNAETIRIKILRIEINKIDVHSIEVEDEKNFKKVNISGRLFPQYEIVLKRGIPGGKMIHVDSGQMIRFNLKTPRKFPLRRGYPLLQET